MMRYIRLIFVALLVVALVSVALANRGLVTLRLLPEEIGTFLGYGQGWSLPLFIVILLAVAVGVALGFIWEWLREMRLRSAAKDTTRKVSQLERELAVLKDSHSIPARDEVLAILEEGERK